MFLASVWLLSVAKGAANLEPLIWTAAWYPNLQRYGYYTGELRQLEIPDVEHIWLDPTYSKPGSPKGCWKPRSWFVQQSFLRAIHNLVIINPNAPVMGSGKCMNQRLPVIGFRSASPMEFNAKAGSVTLTDIPSDVGRYNNAFCNFDYDSNLGNANAKMWMEGSYIHKIRSMKSGGLGESILMGSALATGFLEGCTLSAENINAEGDTHPQKFYELMGFHDANHFLAGKTCRTCAGQSVGAFEPLAMQWNGGVSGQTIQNAPTNPTRSWQRQDVGIQLSQEVKRQFDCVIQKHWGPGYVCKESFVIHRKRANRTEDILSLNLVIQKRSRTEARKLG